MEIFLHTLLALIAVVWFFILNPRLNRSCSKKLPPGPTGLPVVGYLLQLGPKPHIKLAELSKRYGPLMSLKFGSVNTIVASSPEFAKQVLQKHDQVFSGRPLPDAIQAQPNPEATIAWVPGDHQWKNRRRICNTQLFTNQRLDLLQYLRVEKARAVRAIIRKHCGSGNPVDLGRLEFAISLNLISNSIFSVDLVEPDSDSAQEFKDLVWRIMEDASKPNVSDYFPMIRRFDLQGIKRHISSSYVRLHEIFDELIDQRLRARELDPMTRKEDFLDILLDQCQEKGSEFNRVTIKPMMVDLFIAGSDTSAITIEWAMAELLRKPHLLQRAKDELLDVVGATRPVSESDVDRLPYLQAIVKETLRLHPAAPLLIPHKALADVELDGFMVPKDSQVFVNLWAIHRDPKYWVDPYVFRPERFLGSHLDFRGHNFEYIPFGSGRRICPGMPLAIRMVHLMLGTMLHSFNWKLPEEISPESLDMEEQFGVTLKKAIPLCAIPSLDDRVQFQD